MNNRRLLSGLLSIALTATYMSAHGPEVVTLDEIFQTAEANSAQLRTTFSAQAEADREISIARAGRLPDINASLSLSYMGDGFTTDRRFGDYLKAPIPHIGNGVSLSISQPVYTGGAVTNAIELARIKSSAARFATDFQRDNIRFQLVGYYLDIYKNVNLRGVVESNLAAARKLLQEMKARYDQGTVLKNDITRYELLISNLDLQLIKINNIIDILNTNLVTTAGMKPGTIIVPDSTILMQSLPHEDVSWWQSEAYDNSPTLSMARSGIDMNRRAEDIVHSERLPKIGIQAGWNLDGPILVEVPPVNRNLSYWYVGIGVSYNISSLYKTNKSLARSRAATQTSVDRFEALRENIALTVNSDYVHYMEAYEELKTQQKSVELAVQNYNTTSTRYSADMALITDMLDAANARLDAEQRLVNSRINIIYYYYKLLFTSGKI